MPRKYDPTKPPSETIVKQKKADGSYFVLRRLNRYDPKRHCNVVISSETIGWLPPGETDVSKMLPPKKKQPEEKPEATPLTPEIKGLEAIVDPRDAARITYPLDIVLFVILVSCLGGQNTCQQVAEYWKENREYLSKLFPNFPKENISHDTVKRVVGIFGSSDEGGLILSFTEPLLAELKRRVIAIDGQATRAADKNPNGTPRMTLNVFDATNRMCLEQIVVGEKSNEIRYAIKSIENLPIEGAVVTVDALNTQTAFAKKLLEKRADYCFAVKKNQANLFDEITENFMAPLVKKAKKTETLDLAHGRIETRITEVLPGYFLTSTLLKRWPGLEEGVIAKVTSHTTNKKTGAVSDDVRFYISSLEYNEHYIAEEISHIVRQHWAVENNLHWVLDVTFSQDRTQCRNAQYLYGKLALNKIVANFISRLQTIETEETGKKHSSAPVWRTRLSRLESCCQWLTRLYP